MKSFQDRLPSASQKQVDYPEVNSHQGQSSSIRLTFSNVMGGASGAAARSESFPRRTRCAFRDCGLAERKRSPSRRYNSSCCLIGSASVAA